MSDPIVWTIAGSDSGGGAGIQADLKTFQGLGVHGCSVITSLTAQNTQRITRVEHVSPGMIAAQLFALQADLPPAAIKIGMLGGAGTVQAVADFLDTARTIVVCDPVMAATRGATLLDETAQNIFRDEILPRVDLLTPNLLEAERLLSRTIRTNEEVEQAVRDLLRKGPKSVLLKGGHREGPLSQDYWSNASSSAWLTSTRLDTEHTHGGGCTLSAATAAARALGLDELSAVTLAKAYTNQGLRGARQLGAGRNPLAHGGWPANPADLPWITDTAEPAATRLNFPREELPTLYPIVDRADWVERLARLGVSLIQLRAKDLSGAALEAEIRRAVAIAREHGCRLYVNDHWKLALELNAHGVHLGQDDLPGADLAALQAAGIRLGLSTHNYGEIARAMQVIPSYLAIGTLFESPSKSFKHAALGLEAFRKMRPLVGVPVVAIGGITLERAPDVLAAGADSLAVISDIVRAPDVGARVAQWNAL